MQSLNGGWSQERQGGFKWLGLSVPASKARRELKVKLTTVMVST